MWSARLSRTYKAILRPDRHRQHPLDRGELVWHNPGGGNVHGKIVVRDGGDGRFVPGLTVHATLVDANPNEIGSHVQPLLWHRGCTTIYRQFVQIMGCAPARQCRR